MRDMVAASATFQAWCGAANATEALDSIVFYQLAAANDFWPKCIVTHDGVHQGQATGPGATFADQLSILLHFEGEPVDGDTDAEAEAAFTETLGAIIHEIRQQNGIGGRVQIIEYSMVIPAMVTYGAMDTENRRIQAAYVFIVGTGQ